jgi:hypothetical protein
MASSSASPLSSSTHAQRRLQRTRQNLGSHRHDLLVALRVVNRIEKEVLEAEYETWLLDETLKCERVGVLLNGEGGKRAGEDVEVWLRRYCGDCEIALGGVRQARVGLI